MREPIKEQVMSNELLTSVSEDTRVNEPRQCQCPQRSMKGAYQNDFQLGRFANFSEIWVKSEENCNKYDLGNDPQKNGDFLF